MDKLSFHDEIKMAFKLLVYKKSIFQFPYLSLSEIRLFQLEKIKQLICNAYLYIPFYHKKYSQHRIYPDDIKSFDDFLLIPTITKKDVVEHEDEFIDKRYKKNKLIISQSSGSSGQFVKLYSDSNMFITEELQVLRMIYELYPEYDRLQKEVLVYTSEYPISSILGFYRIYYINNLKSYQEIFSFILDKRPTVLAIYPSILREIIHNVSFDFSLLNLKLIITNSEQSSLEERLFFENLFLCRVIDEFSSEELQSIAYECSCRSYHEVSDCSYIEILSQQSDKPVGIGETGEITGTCLINDVMPMIRYRQGDMAIRTDQTCRCGKKTPLIGTPIGRINSSFITEDDIVIPSGRLLDWTYSLKLKHSYNIDEFQVVQETVTDVLILIVGKLSKKEMFSIRTEFIETFGKCFQVNIRMVKRITKTHSGKHIPIFSRVYEHEN